VLSTSFASPLSDTAKLSIEVAAELEATAALAKEAAVG